MRDFLGAGSHAVDHPACPIIHLSPFMGESARTLERGDQKRFAKLGDRNPPSLHVHPRIRQEGQEVSAGSKAEHGLSRSAQRPFVQAVEKDGFLQGRQNLERVFGVAGLAKTFPRETRPGNIHSVQ